MNDLEKLKILIDETNYPYFTDEELIVRLNLLDGRKSIESLARSLCIEKAGIESIKLGDVTIPSPRNHFLMLASKYRKNHTGVVTRADERFIL